MAASSIDLSPLRRWLEPPLLYEGLAVLAAVAVWFALLGLVLLLTRPRDVEAAGASTDFGGDEPPALVSLFAGGWRLNEDAAESTLIDLAARGFLELRQPAADPRQTTVHLKRRDESGLTAYERRVLDRVRSQASGGMVPLTALTFRDTAEAGRWTSALHAEVLRDAKARGLTRPRVSPAVKTFLTVAALLPAAVLAAVVFDQNQDGEAALGAGAGAFLALGSALAVLRGVRETREGRAVAQRWMGLREFLRNDEAFADLPPAAVTVWDRYLSYGDALGVTRVSSAVIDLGMGSRKRVWSSYGGTWHRVRVRYPRFWGRYGRTALGLGFPAVLTLAAGIAVLHYRGPVMDSAPDQLPPGAAAVSWWVGFLLVIRGGYRLIRTIVDVASPVTITGEALWIQLWRTEKGNNDNAPVPVLYYFALDDGKEDRTTAWGIPAAWSSQAAPGDVVTVKVRRWSRRVTSITVVESRAAQLAQQAAHAAAALPAPSAADAAAEAAVPATGGAAAVTALTSPAAVLTDPAAVLTGSAQGATVVAAALAASTGAPAEPVADATTLLTAEEVGRAVGEPVSASTDPAARMSLGPFDLMTFFSATGQERVLSVATMRGLAARLALRSVRKAPALPGIGDEAWAQPDWAMARSGDTVVRINLETAARRTADLPSLLSTAVSRLP